MDPKQCLMDCDQAISDLHLDDADYALDAYRTWRLSFGFEPVIYGKRGDKFADYCARRIHDVRAQS